MAKVDYQYAIDTPRTSRNSGTVIIGGGSGGSGGGGSVDLSLYLKRDGTVPMTGNLDMGDFGIINVSLVDGVDIPAHVANANAHHNKIHVLANQTDLGDDHTIVGSIGQVLRVYATNKARFEQLSHTDLANVLPDQHHNRQHNVATSNDHTASGTSTFDVFGIPGSANVLGWLTPSFAPTGASILRSNNSGGLELKELKLASAMTLFSSGNVDTSPDIEFFGSGLLASQVHLYINYDSNASGTGSVIFSKSSRLNSGRVEVARLDNSGNFGLGMSAGASYRLDVSGNARVSATAQAATLIATTKVTTPLIDSASGSVTVSPSDSMLVVNNKIRVQNIDTNTGQSLTIFPADSLILSPGDNRVVLENGKALRTDVFVSGFAGSGFHLDQGILRAGKTTFEVDDLVVRGRMSVYELLIRQIRATNGSLFVSSTAKVKRVDTIAGGYRLWTTTEEETPTNATEHAHGFLPGDIIRAQRTRWNGTQFTGVYQSDLRVTDMDATLSSFRAVLVSGDIPTPGMEFVRLGNTTDTTRQGVIYLTSDDTASPFIDIVNGITSHTDWNGTGFVKARLGLITGITSTANEYGIIAGNGIFSPTNVNAKYIRASNEGVFLYGAGLKMYKSGAQTVDIANDGTMWLGPNSSNKIFEFDGNVLNLRGALLIGPQIPNAGFTTDAVLYCAFNGTQENGNASGNANGHLGQIPVLSGNPQFRSGKFGKAMESCESLTSTKLNLVINSSLEDGTVGSNPTNYGTASNQYNEYYTGTLGANSSITVSNDMAYDGQKSYKILRRGFATTTDNYGIRYRYSVISGETYSIQAKVFVSYLSGRTANSLNVKLLGSTNVVFSEVGVGGLTGDWVTLKIKVTATATGTSYVYVYTDNCSAANVYVDALQITQTTYHLPYYNPVSGQTSRSASAASYDDQIVNFQNATISTWLKLEDTGTSVGRHLRIAQVAENNPNNRTIFYISSSNRAVLYYENGGEIISLSNSSQPEIVADTWYHMAATYNNGVVKLFINGVLCEENSFTTPIVGVCRVIVGAYETGGHMNGWVDDFAIIPRALSNEEISQIYSSQAPLRVLSSAFELQLTKISTTGLINSIVGNASGIFASVTSSSSTTPSFGLFNDNVASWGGFTSLKAGDVIIGDSAGQYLKFKREDGTMILKGQLIITGASGYASFTDKPTSLADIDAAQNTKLTNIQAGATVGADWDSNLSDIPIRFGNAPVGGTAGLYLTPTHLGYYNGSAWKMWMSSAGQFYFGSDSGARIQWNGSLLAGYNSGNTLQWSASSTTGLLTAGGGNVEIGADGQFFYTQSITINNFAEPSLNYPNTTPAIAQRVKWRDTAAGPWTGSTGTKNYNGNEVLRLYVSSQHFISGTNEGFWEHYIDGVLETPSITTPGTSGSYYRRLWLKSQTIVLDANLQITGALIQTSSALELKSITGSLWQQLSLGNLVSNGNITATGNVVATGAVSGNELYSETGNLRSDSYIKAYAYTTGAKQGIGSAGLMSTNDYAHTTRVPSNGIYSLGGVSIARTASPDASYKLDVLGDTRLTGTLSVTGATSFSGMLSLSDKIKFSTVTASPPSITSGDVQMYVFAPSGDLGKKRFVISYNNGSAIKYRWIDLDGTANFWNHSESWADVVS